MLTLNGGAVALRQKEMYGLGKNRTGAGVLNLPQNPDFSGNTCFPADIGGGPQSDCRFDHILQLAHISRPIVRVTTIIDGKRAVLDQDE